MCVEIELVGGAVDGRRLTICCDPMNPQPIIEIAELRSLNGTPESDLNATTFQHVHYARDPEPTRADTDPLWLYRRQVTA